MSFGVCLLSIVPCRKLPDSTSEMVTQLLFGETYVIVEAAEDWISIITTFDQYPCWISAKQHNSISEVDFKNSTASYLSSELVQVVSNKVADAVFPVTIGSVLLNLNNKQIKIDENIFSFDGSFTNIDSKKSVEEITNTAYLFLNAPYLWGGRSPFGIDCSGFTQLVFKINGYILPRNASQQVELGTPLSFVDEATAGDLAFFDNEQGNITHVGIMLDNQKIIHASGSVRMDKIDHYGIYNTTTKKYSHQLRVIKKII